jgi:DNA-binding transcriptional regulator YdaS (Cro superfamily)
MDLAYYLKRENLSYAAFGRVAGIPRVTVRQYALKQRTRISPANLRKIIKATSGDVTANDLYGVGSRAA